MDKQQHRSKIEESPQPGPIDQHKTTLDQMRNPIDNKMQLTTESLNRGTDFHTRYEQPRHIIVDNEHGENQNNPRGIGHKVPDTTTKIKKRNMRCEDEYNRIDYNHQSLPWHIIKNYLHTRPRTETWVWITKASILRRRNHANTTNRVVTRRERCYHSLIVALIKSPW